jgi:hypothetical protein
MTKVLTILIPILCAIGWTVWVTLAHSWNGDTAVVGGLLYVSIIAWAIGWYECYFDA